jgi:ABC-type Fe3+ transport system substrate-binding protein
MFRKTILSLAPLAILVLVPIVLRHTVAEPKKTRTESSAPARKLVIVTPHSEAIRFEFARAFEQHVRETDGAVVEIEWRTPGGTSDITRYVDDLYVSSFRRYWQARRELGPWTAKVAHGFNDHRIRPDDPTADSEIRTARTVFLASDAGIGIDLFFGGGQYEMEKQARKGHAVDAGILKRRPEWFIDEIIPRKFQGETFYDSEGRYYGTCLAAFGICYNRDRISALSDSTSPIRWGDLGDPRFHRAVIVADPTKSGSINKCFEMLIQERMADALARKSAEEDEAEALSRGWAEAMNLIRRIGANATVITDSASKVTRDVAAGEAAVGMCIDVYGRTEAEWTRTETDGREERLVYVDPRGGTSYSTDPIMMFRGASEPELAADFIEFVLSEKGQKLWDYRLGTPGGPVQYALRRLPIRRDLYTPAHRMFMADPDAAPYEPAEPFLYRGSWTGPYFNLIRVLVKCMVIDPLPELQRAWTAILDAGGPDVVPNAVETMNRLPFGYAECADASSSLIPGGGRKEADILATRREWSEFFRKQYIEAERMAKEKRQRDP